MGMHDLFGVVDDPVTEAARMLAQHDLFVVPGSVMRECLNVLNSAVPYGLNTRPTPLAALGSTDVLCAALFVQPDGCYAGMRTVDAWPEHRDARRYAGLNRPGSRSEAEAGGSELKPLLGEEKN